MPSPKLLGTEFAHALSFNPQMIEAIHGTVEFWGRDPTNPIGGWYGLKKGLRGRFGVYIPPLMEELGLCELEHNPKNNRIRAK